MIMSPGFSAGAFFMSAPVPGTLYKKAKVPGTLKKGLALDKYT